MKRIFAILLSLLFFAACVPTPEEEYVTHKDAEEMLGKAETDGAPDMPIREQYGIPETVRDEAVFSDGAFTVRIDANVEVPDTNAIPILRVERDLLDQETITAIFRKLTAGRTLYRGEDSSMTKTQIAESITEMEEMLENPSLDDSTRAFYEEQIAAMKAQFPNAPDSGDEMVPSDGTMYSYPCQISPDSPTFLRFGLRLQTNDELPQQTFYVNITDPDNPNTTENGKDAVKSMNLYFMDDRNRARGSDGQTRVVIQEPNDPVELEAYTEITYLPAQAIEDAKQYFKEIGRPEIVPDSIALCFDGTKTAYGYRITCLRSIDGIGVASLGGGYTTGTDQIERYAPEWSYEEIELCIDEKGIYGFTWSNPIRVTETLLEATKLQPFERIPEAFVNQMWTENAAWIVSDLATTSGDENGFCTTGLDFEVTRITLSLQRVMEPNRFDSGMLVPVWNFWGVRHKTETHKTTGEQRTVDRDTRLRQPFLSINAIDGSVIDPWKGY